MSTIKPLYGTSNQAITCSFNTLAASATVGRAATAIDNSSGLFLDILLFGLISAGTVSGNKQFLVYVTGSADGGTTYGGKNGSNAISGTDAAFTRADPTELVLVKVIPLPTSSQVYSFGPISLAQVFGGTLPDHVVVVVFNDSGGALANDSTNNKLWYQGVQAQSV